MQIDRVPVAREGAPFIGAGGFTALILAILGWWLPALAALAATGFILWFFRDPHRLVPTGDDLVLAPADGRVIAVEKGQAPEYPDGPSWRLAIFMNVFDVHVNRAPVAGYVLGRHHRPGRFYSADTDRGGLENERATLVLETQGGQRLTLVQIAGLVARRIVCWAEVGDRLELGQRFGLIRFGSRVDLYLPASAVMEVAVGDRVRAGETVVARLAPATPAEQ